MHTKTFYNVSVNKIQKKHAVSIKTKFALLLSILMLFLTIITCLIIGLQFYYQKTNEFKYIIKQEFSVINTTFQIFMKNNTNVLRMLAEHPAAKKADESIQSYITETAGDNVQSPIDYELRTLVRHIRDNFSELSVVYLGTKWGGHATSRDKMSTGYDPRKRSWYQQANTSPGKTVITAAYISSDKKPTVTFTKTVTNQQGAIIGCAGIDVNLEYLTNFMETIRVGTKGYAMLVQNDGIILADPKHQDFNFKSLKDTSIPALNMFSTMQEGSVNILMDGSQWRGYVFTIPGFDWKVVIFVEKSEILASFYTVLKNMIFIVLILFAVIVLVSFIFSKRLSVYFKRLEVLFSNLADGDMTSRFDSLSNDEIGIMMSDFNRTLDNVSCMISSAIEESQKMHSIGETLTSNVTETASAITQISSHIKKVSKQTSKLAMF